MALLKLIRRTPLKPEDVQRLVAADEKTALPAGRIDGNDPVTEIVAKTIIEICQTGIRDPDLISQRAKASVDLWAASAGGAPKEMASPTLRGVHAFFLGLILTGTTALVGMLLFVAFAR